MDQFHFSLSQQDQKGMGPMTELADSQESHETKMRLCMSEMLYQ